MENLKIPKTIENLDKLLDYYDNKYSVSTEWYQNILIEYSKGMRSVVEFGTWNGQGVAIFAKAGVKKITSCDIDLSRVDQNTIKNLCVDSEIEFAIEDSINPSKEYVADFIFFDTMHTYKHVLKELRARAEGAQRYFAVHDTNYPPKHKNPERLVRDAVLQYLDENDNFELELEDDRSTGIMIARRRG